MTTTNVLVIGGLTCIPEALVTHLCKIRDEECASISITVVEKIPFDIARISTTYTSMLKTIDYRVGNWHRPEFLTEVFNRPDGNPWDYVFNLAVEARFGQTEQAYKRDILDLTSNIATIAAQSANVSVLIHLSTARVYAKSSKTSPLNSEDAPTYTAESAPNDYIKYHILAENRLKDILDNSSPGALHVVVIRPALPYGPGDRFYVAPLLMMGEICHAGKEDIKVLWERGLPVSTVHVEDIACAMFTTAKWQKAQHNTVDNNAENSKSLVVFNVADNGNTTNEKIAEVISNVFGIKKSFHDAIINAVAKRMRTQDLTDEVNQSFLGPWMELLAESGIPNSPFTPYLDKEHPYCSLSAHPFGVDGSYITNSGLLGLEFKYKHPTLQAEVLRALIDEMVALRLWPTT